MVLTRRASAPLVALNEQLTSISSSQPSSDSTQATSSANTDGEGEAPPHDEINVDATAHAGNRQLRLHTPSDSDSGSAYEDEDAEEENQVDVDFQSDSDFKNLTDSEDRNRERRRQSKSKKAGSPPKRDPNAPRISKLQKKIQDARAHGIELDENGVRKGMVRHTTNGLEYRHEGQWIPAVYHTDIRKKLLQVSEALGRYREQPLKGYDELDRTAFKEEQKKWVFSDRQRRPGVLFLWKDPKKNADYEPQLWYDDDRIVLDTKNHPLKLWNELPFTISGQCEGYRMETWRRLNTRITMSDLRARMPLQTCKGDDKVSKTIKTPMLANRMARDRIKFGIKAWDPKQGSDIKVFRMLQTMPEAVQRSLLQTNSTRHYRDLTDDELTYVDLGNKGTAASLAKAGPRQLDQAARQAYQQKKKKQKRYSRGEPSTVKVHPVIKEHQDDLKPKNKRQKTKARSPASPATSASGYPPMSPSQEEIEEGHSEPIIIESDDEEELVTPNVLEDEDEDEEWNEQSSLPPAVPSVEHNNGLPSAPFTVYRAASPATANEYVRMQQEAAAEINAVPLPSDRRSTGTQETRRMRDLGLERIHGSAFGIDYRYKKPDSRREADLIEEALQISRDDFTAVLGVAPRRQATDLQPYAFQLNQLEAEFADFFQGTHGRKLKQWGYMRDFEDFGGIHMGGFMLDFDRDRDTLI